MENKPERIPVTIDMLKMIKLELGDMEISLAQKRLIWAVCTLNFFGGFRVSETLSKAEGYFDPCFTLLRRDIRIKQIKIGKETEKIFQVRLKSPKEDGRKEDPGGCVRVTRHPLPCKCIREVERNEPPSGQK